MENNKTDRIISYSAIVIALASIIISIWQGIETRNHNRLSVTPRLNITYHAKSNEIKFKVKNNGLGPALIRDCTISFDGKKYKSYGPNELYKFLEYLEIEGILNFSIIGESSLIPAGEEENLLIFYSDSLSEEMLLHTLPNSLGFKIEYSSMYDEHFTSTNDVYDELDEN
ncbi:MAG: hypothetical protein JXR48_13480 [Candidatus Delongbacteria bacterium]|nr:hypothetical protein [Candidatus Delongbacteria bacterium]MBN2835967.1 hypothetical protein [Candidatus Delongbacteria bacterium]